MSWGFPALARARRWLLAFVLALACVLPSLAFGSDDYALAEPGDWVDVYKLEGAELETEASASDGALYLLSDAQVRWDGESSEFYYRLVTKVSEPDALSDAGSIQLSYDPSYEELTIHGIAITRDGRTSDRLASARVDVLQREESLERRLLDGERTVSIEIEDLRVGDRIEYSYTRSGSNPVWRGHHFRTFPLEYSVPVRVLRARLTVPRQRYSNLQYRNGSLEPTVTMEGQETTYEWARRSVPGADSDGDAPSWHLGAQAVQVSSFRSWRDIIEREMPLYASPEKVSAPLQALIDEIRQEHAEPEARLREILARVQADIRYLGIELGVGGFVPRDPSVVFERRFGDCKDKSLLMVTMARAMGIDAFPAIVDTNNRVAMNEMIPTPAYFDHVIVLARIGEESFWLDPTRTLQSGALGEIYQPHFGKAMVLEPGAVDLVEMTPSDSDIVTVLIDEVFDLSRSFDGSAATYRIASQYKSYRADFIREDLRADGVEELQERFFNYYKRKRPGLAVAEAMTVVDDLDENILTVHESYTIDDPWRWDPEDSRFEFSASPYEVESNLGKPDVVDRSAPYAKTHPIHTIQKTAVILPFGRAVDVETIATEHPAFRFSKETRYDAGANTVALEYRYVSKADAVAAEDLDSYLLKVDEADDLGWYWVSTRHLSERGEAGFVDYSQLIGFAALGYMFLLPPGWFVYRRLRPVVEHPDAEYFPVGRLKFLVMSVLTGGLYVAYWGYRNWLSIKRRDASKVTPRLLGMFFALSYFWFVRDVNRTAVQRGVETLPGAAWFGLGLLVWSVGSAMGMSELGAHRLPLSAQLGVQTLNSLIATGWLLPCVSLVGRLNRNTPAGLHENSRFRMDAWLAILVCLPLVLVSLNGSWPTSEPTNVSPSAIAHLEERELLDEGESVELFRAPNDLTFRRAASVITDRKVLRYWASEDLDHWYSAKAAYDEIVAMTFEGASGLGPTRAHFVRRQGDSVDLLLPAAEGEGAEVIRRLVSRSPAATVTYKGLDGFATEAE